MYTKTNFKIINKKKRRKSFISWNCCHILGGREKGKGRRIREKDDREEEGKEEEIKREREKEGRELPQLLDLLLQWVLGKKGEKEKRKGRKGGEEGTVDGARGI